MKALQNLAPEDAFRLALEQTGLNFGQCCKKLGWGATFGRRVLSAEKFYPSFQDLPKFCTIVGNTLIIDWLLAQIAHHPHEATPVTSQYLTKYTLDMCAEMGGLAKTVQVIVANEKITLAEKRKLIKELLHLVDMALGIAGNLRNCL